MARLDHITIVAHSLEAGAAEVEAALGIAPGPGREHPAMATHNRLLALGPSVYLEVIAANPNAMPVSRPRWFGLDELPANSTPRLAWVASTDDIERAVVPELGLVETMRRDVHTWRMAVRADGRVPFDGAGPLLIQRAPGADPVASLPVSGLHFERLVIRHPAPERIRALLARIELAARPRVEVEFGKTSSLVAEISTPAGTRTLGVRGTSMAVSDAGPFFHGTRARLRIGDLLTAGFRSNYDERVVMNHIYFTALSKGAGLAAEMAKGDGRPCVYVVEPTGEFSDDPNVTDKKFAGNPTRSYRSEHPLRIVGELDTWEHHDADFIQQLKRRVEAGMGEIIN